MGESIVPIVVMTPREGIVRCLGTGFFISSSGLLVTAAHVVSDPIDRGYGGVKRIDEGNWWIGSVGLGIMMPTNPIFQAQGHFFRPIEWAGFLATPAETPLPFMPERLKLTSDVAICKVAPRHDAVPDQPLSIVQPGVRGVGLQEGKNATVIGYAGMKDVFVRQDGEQFHLDDALRFELHVSMGRITQHLPDNGTNRQAQTPGPCFAASFKLPAGMSGSPIFDDERIYVHGVASVGLEEEAGPSDHAYGAMLAPSLGLPIAPLGGKSLLDLMKSDEAGIPKFTIPDA